MIAAGCQHSRYACGMLQRTFAAPAELMRPAKTKIGKTGFSGENYIYMETS